MTVLDAPAVHRRDPPVAAGTRPRAMPWPPRPPRRVAGIPTGLLVCWQAALVPALVAIGRPAGHVIGLGITAAVVVAVTGLRPRGRWLHEWVVLGARYLARGPGEPSPGRPPELAILDLAVRTEAVSEIEIEGHQVAVISHAHGCTAVLELDPGALPPGLPRLPLTLAPRHEPDGPAISVQLVMHATPAATAAPVRAWLAVQVRRDPAYPTEELHRALVSAVRRLRRRLRGAAPGGVDARALDRAGLLRALHTVTGLELTAPITPGGADPVGTEQWRTWWTRSVPHETLAVRSWPGLQPALFDTLLGQRCPLTVSVAARRLHLPAAAGGGIPGGAVAAGEEVVAVELMVRLAERDRSTLDAAVRQMSDRLAAVGAGVERLDGRQLPGLAATLPVGGFLPGHAPSAASFAPRPARVHRTRSQGARHTATMRPQHGPAIASQPSVGRAAPVPAGAGTSPATPTWSAPPAATSAPTAFEVPTAPLTLPRPAQPPVAVAHVHVPQPAPSPARGQARVPAPPPPAEPARGHAPAQPAPPPPFPSPPLSPAPLSPAPLSPAPQSPPPQSAPPQSAPPPQSPPPPPRQRPPDAHGAVRAYGASLFTADAAQRALVEQLVAAVRTPYRSPQVVSVVSGVKGLGASTTAAGLARTLATLRDDYVALLSAEADPVDPATIHGIGREHGFVVVDVGAHVSEATPQALAASTRVVVVTGADRRATAATRHTLDRIHQVHPALASDAVVAVVCRTGRHYREVSRGLGGDASPQAARIVPIPPDAALRKMDQLDLARLRTPTREAYLRLAAALAAPRPGLGDTQPTAPVPTFHPLQE